MTVKTPQLKRVTVTPHVRQNALDKPWHSYLTIDTINLVLHRTVLHPFIAWMVPLSMRAQVTPWHYLSMQIALAYATIVTLRWMFGVISNRIAYGLPRDVDLSEEVVVITGGGSGLGQLIAEVYGMRGASVAILDVKDVEDADAKGVTFYKCDVGQRAQVQQVAKEIEKDLGVPTILINNAGVVKGKPLLDLSFDDVDQTIKTNLLSHFYTIKTFLPGMLDEGRGTIVTISSVLGHLGAANLTDYTASKAGLLALHASLKAELASSSHESAQWIRTILCTPVVEPHEVAKEIIKLIDAGESGEFSAPLYARWISLFGVLPAGVQKIVRSLSGIDKAIT